MKLLRTTSLAWLLWAAAVPGSSSASWHPDAPRYGVATLKNVPIRMSDGVVLRADVDVPVPPGHSRPVPGLRFPTLVTQTAYYKDGPVAKLDPYFVQRGYAEVLADVRGTGSSQGQWQMLGPLEQEDGVQVIHWAARQPWSDGRIGLMGGSYSAINQLLIMERPDAPPEVKAILPVSPMADPYRDLVFHGGAFDDEFMSQWLGLTTAASLAPSQQAAGGGPDAAMIEAQHATGLNLSANLLANGLAGGSLAYDGEFWHERAPIEHIAGIKVPTLIVGGEFDIFQRGIPLLFQGLRAPKRLIIGPWVHGRAGSTLPADGIPSKQELSLQWYDQYLKGENTPIARAPRVEQYRLEGSRPSHFVASHGWPLPGLRPLDLYLSGRRSGSANSPNDGTLTGSPSSGGGADTLVYDPGGTPCSRATFQWGAQSTTADESSSKLPCEGDQRLDEGQELTYTTPRLAKPLTIDGPIDLHLLASSPHHANTVFSVTVCDVAPSGASVALTGGWLVASERATRGWPWAMSADGQPLRVYHPFTRASEHSPPATPTAYDIEIFPTFATLLPGHRLRLDIGTGQLPHVMPTFPEAMSSAGGTFLIAHTMAGDSSRLILPQIAAAPARPAARDRPQRKPHPRPDQPSQITYGISPTTSIADPASTVGRLVLAHLAYLRGRRSLLVHLYLPWRGYPDNLPGIDREVAALAARGYQVDIVLRYAPPSGHNGDSAGYGRFVRAVVAHFAHRRAVTRLGITNESNFSLDKRGSLGGADGQYADPIGALIAGMAAAYRERARDHAHMKLGFNWAYRGCDPTACGPAADTDYWSELGRRGGARFAHEVDWVAMDIYPGTIFPPGSPSADPYQPGLSPAQEIASSIEDLRYQLMPLAGLGPSIPIGVQEISWATVPPARPEAEQASLLAQFSSGACQVARQTNFRSFYWFTLNDPPAGRNLDFGLYHPNGTPKPAAAAYQRTIAKGCP